MKENLFLFVFLLLGLAAVRGQEGDVYPLPYEQHFDSQDVSGWEFRVNGQPFDVTASGFGAIYISEGKITSHKYWDDGVSGASDNWIISPRFYLDHEGCFLLWKMWCYGAQLDCEVAVSVSGTDSSDFVPVCALEPDQHLEWVDVMVDLSQFAGQYIRVAFHHRAESGNFLFLDDIVMSDGSPRILSLSGPNRVYPMEPKNFKVKVVSVNRCDYRVEAPGLEEYRVEDSATISLRFGVEEGLDTISVELVADNMYGTDTSQVKVLLMSECYLNVVEDYPYTAPMDGSGCWRNIPIQESSSDAWGFGGSWFSASGRSFDQCLVGPSMLITEEVLQLHLIERMSGQFQYGVYLYEGDLVEGLDTGLLAPLRTMQHGSETSGGTLYEDFLIEDHMGEVVRLVIRCRPDDGEFANYRIENLTVSWLQPPTIRSVRGPRRVEMGETATFVADVGSAIPYECFWEVEGGELYADSDSVEVIWEGLEPGEYEVMCVAENSAGYDTARLSVVVYSCDGVFDFPYEPLFSEMDELECWETWSDTPGSGWRLSYGGVYVQTGGTDHVDTWLVSPYLSLPDSDVEELCFRYDETPIGHEETSLSVYFSTTGKEMENFELLDVLDFASLESGGGLYTKQLGDYLGAGGYVALRYQSEAHYSFIELLDLAIRPTVSSIYIDMEEDTVNVGQTKTFRAVRRGLVELRAWSVDNVTQTELSDTLEVTFDRGGYHTVKVEAVAMDGTLLEDQVLCWINSVGVLDVLMGCAGVYPNPTGGRLFVVGEVERVEIYDDMGRLLKAEMSPRELDLYDVPQGVYFVRLIEDGSMSIVKVVKK